LWTFDLLDVVGYLAGNSVSSGESFSKSIYLTKLPEIIAARFIEANVVQKAMWHNAVPDKVAMDKSGANQAALEPPSQERVIPITIKQVKYLNNIVEQGHRAVKRVARRMIGSKSFRAARAILAGIELVHMIRKGQFRQDGEGMSFADQFYVLARQLRPV
jgi:transposase-like protein